MFKKGNIPWNKDLKTGPQNQDHIDKAAKARMGKRKPLSEEHKKKLSISMTNNMIGDKNPAWTGGNDEWWAKELKKIHKSCSLCRSTNYLEMHHKDHNRQNNKRENLIILCIDCHSFWHRN